MKTLNGWTKLDRKEELNVLYQVCVSGLIGKQRWPPIIGLPFPRLNAILTKSKNSMSSTKFVFFGPIREKMAAPSSDWPIHFQFIGTHQHDRKQELMFLYVVFLWANQNTKMAAPAPDNLKTFLTPPLKPLNGIWWHMTDSKFSISRYSLKNVFSGRTKNKDGDPGLWIGTKTFTLRLIN